MRTTWLILLLMVLAGAVMYYLATREKPPAPYDTISIRNTPDSIRKNTRLMVAFQPVEVVYKDSTWTTDSVPLKQIILDSSHNAFDKHYSSVTFFLDYDHRYFYDLEIPKPDPELPYNINFEIRRVNDTLQVSGTIDNKKAALIRFNGPMMKMYKAFMLTYNNRLPADSTQPADSSTTRATKTITVIGN